MSTSLRVSEVRAELSSGRPYIGTPTPRLSWKVATTSRNWIQRAASVQLDEAEIVPIASGDSVLIEWPFPPLEAGSRHSVRVRVVGQDGIESAWSEPLEIVAAFLRAGQWNAEHLGLAEPKSVAQPFLVRREILVDEGLVEAMLYATARGAYQFGINGSDVDDHLFKPGWTSYQLRLVHQSTDVTGLLRPGINILGATVAGAWFTESYGFAGNAERFYGDQPTIAAQLVLRYADGHLTSIATDDEWRVSPESPIRSSGIYAGEHFDARILPDIWTTVDLDHGTWERPRVESGTFPTPEPDTAPPVRCIETIPVIEVVDRSPERILLDFGQNLVGRLRITVRGERGNRVSLRHAEVLQDGELSTRPLRDAAATDSYTLSGIGEEKWEPQFTFHGFRYAELRGWPGDFDERDVVAVVVHSDMQRTGWFNSSHPELNQLHRNVVWGMRGNFLSIPTDCPQRDERLGWTGDIQVFAPTASFLYDVNGFLSHWLTDLRLEQANIAGVVPRVVPNVFHDKFAAAAWGDAAALVPLTLYNRFGDVEILRHQWESMRDWVEAVRERATSGLLWAGQPQFGDWLDPDAPPEAADHAKADPDVIATAYFYRSTEVVAQVAALIGREKDASRYSHLAATIKKSFLHEYVSSAGRIVSDAPTVYAIAINFGLFVDENQRASMGDRLAELTRIGGYRIATGFVGTPLIADALTVTGHSDVAGRLVTQTENPSWLYSVLMGATTIWERWDSLLEDGSVNPGEMTSFNHYALGSIADWLHRAVAGLAAASPGYRSIRVEPHFLPQLTSASATHETPYGPASCSWSRVEDSVSVTVTIPPNTTASVALPGHPEKTMGSGTYSWELSIARQTEPAEPLGLGSSIADLIDRLGTYQAVISAVRATDPLASERLRKHTRWIAGKSIAELIEPLSLPTRAAVLNALKSTP